MTTDKVTVGSADKFTATPVQTTPSHVTVRVFVNGASAGLLTLRIKEAPEFVDRISVGNPLEFSASIGAMVEDADNAEGQL